MKKVLKVFLSLVMIFVITGCGKNEQVKERKPVEVLNDTLKNETSIDEMKVDMSFSVKASTGGISIDSNINAIVSAVKDGENAKLVFELSDNPFVGAIKGYVSLTDTEVVTYIPSKIYNMIYNIDNENDIYVKNVETLSTDDDSSEETQNLNEIDLSSILTDDDFYLINKTDDYGMYRLVVSKELLERITKSIDSETTSDINDFKGTINLNVTIDEKNNRITEISCDLIDFVKANISSLDLGEDVNVDEIIQNLSFNFKIQYTDVEVAIPNEVINNSMPAEEYDYNEESYE